jgi:hypothetical protein
MSLRLCTRYDRRLERLNQRSIGVPGSGWV